MDRFGVRAMAVALGLAFGLAVMPAHAAGTEPPAPGTSKRIDEIKSRGTLRVAVLGEFPWLKENTSGLGEPFEGSAWYLANEYAKRLGVKLETVPVSHETKVPIVATGQADISIAPLSLTDARKKVADFVVYSKSTLCLFGKADNPKLTKAGSVDDLNTEDITIAYFTGTPPETWLPERLPKAVRKGVQGSGANAPVDEIMSGRADIAPIDTAAWVDLAKKIPGLVSFPKGDECLKAGEFPTEVGLAIDKNQPEFLAWLTAVYDEVKDKVAEEELRVLKE
jgi:polar amino acid transport system substrate-binding protein